MTRILHITTQEAWREADEQGHYSPASLAAEGFIHCSTAAQTQRTANAFFKGASDLVLLVINEDKVTADVRYEPPADNGEADPNDRFPHVYGALNLDAVTRVIAFPANADGSFTLPEELAGT